MKCTAIKFQSIQNTFFRNVNCEKAAWTKMVQYHFDSREQDWSVQIQHKVSVNTTELYSGISNDILQVCLQSSLYIEKVGAISCLGSGGKMSWRGISLSSRSPVGLISQYLAIVLSIPSTIAKSSVTSSVNLVNLSMNTVT